MSTKKPDCVCGAPYANHFAHFPGGCLITTSELGGLLCGNYSPVLSWPDSEGWWWMQTDVIESICHAKLVGDAKVVIAIALLDDYHDYRNETHGPARFAKLLEPNPFQAN